MVEAGRSEADPYMGAVVDGGRQVAAPTGAKGRNSSSMYQENRPLGTHAILCLKQEIGLFAPQLVLSHVAANDNDSSNSKY